MKKLATVFAIFTLFLLLGACKSDVTYYYYSKEETEVLSQYLNLPEIPDDYNVSLPSHLRNVGLFPRAVERDKAVLGRVIFYDKKLSKDGTVSCATCHKQELAFSDDKAYSDGVLDRSTGRNSIALGSVANFSAYYGTDLNGASAIRFFWDNRAETAADQSRGSMTNEKEMDMSMHEIAATVEAQPYYGPLFNKAFGSTVVTEDLVLEAVANFVNAMGSYQSKFDEEANKSSLAFTGFGNIIFTGNFTGFTQAENEGKTLYNTHCSSCHSGNMGRPILQLANNGLDSDPTDLGVGGVTGRTDEKGSFKVPTLRNISLTAPYMHDGRFSTLNEVIDFYSNGIQEHPFLHADLKQSNGQPKKMNFTESQKSNLIAFLNTLTDDRLLGDKKFSDPFKQ